MSIIYQPGESEVDSFSEFEEGFGPDEEDLDDISEADNNLENPDLFNDRLIYKQKSFLDFDVIPLDMIYEKPFYGKVDIYGTTVYPSETDMAQIPGAGLLLVHNFVAKAFNDLKRYMDTNIVSRERYFQSLFPSFIPKSATKNFH